MGCQIYTLRAHHAPLWHTICLPILTWFSMSLPPPGEHVQLTKDNVCAVLHNAGIQSPDWEKIAKSLGLDAAILSSAFFTQWYAVARDRKPSWKALSTMLDNQKYPQAAMSVREMKGLSTTLLRTHVIISIYNYAPWSSLLV